MYRVRVMVSLMARNGPMGLSRWLRLPFVPVSGLDLHGITSDPDRAEIVAAVGWDVGGGYFHPELLDCVGRGESLSDLIDHYGPDWQLHEPGINSVPEVGGAQGNLPLPAESVDFRLNPVRHRGASPLPSGVRAGRGCAGRKGER